MLTQRWLCWAVSWNLFTFFFSLKSKFGSAEIRPRTFSLSAMKQLQVVAFSSVRFQFGLFVWKCSRTRTKFQNVSLTRFRRPAGSSRRAADDSLETMRRRHATLRISEKQWKTAFVRCWWRWTIVEAFLQSDTTHLFHQMGYIPHRSLVWTAVKLSALSGVGGKISLQFKLFPHLWAHFKGVETAAC